MTRPDFTKEAQKALEDPWGSGVSSDTERAVIDGYREMYERGEVAGRGDALAVVEALKRYGTHLPVCPLRGTYYNANEQPWNCTCGFLAVLEGR